MSVQTLLTWKIFSDFSGEFKILFIVLLYLYILWNEESETFEQTKALVKKSIYFSFMLLGQN